jgi:prepilin signal peptidase PulO-like enzyme (type II secretory pathway)
VPVTTAYFGFLAVLLGASVGSFLNVVADRVPNGRSLISPGSFCESCNTTLGVPDLIPIFSYLWLGGKCRHCGAKYSGRMAVVEAGTGVLFLLVFLRFDATLDFVLFAAVTALLIAITLIDLDHQLILNKMIVPVIVILLILSPFWEYVGFDRTFFRFDGPLGSFANSVTAGAVYSLVLLSVLLFYLFVRSVEGMGLGDVKLAVLLGLLFGFPLVIVVFWVAVVSGGVVAIFLWLSGRVDRMGQIPYGPYMAAGAYITILAGEEIWTWYSEFALGFGGAS